VHSFLSATQQHATRALTVARARAQVSWRDVLVVMDCDHLVERPFFHKACACLLDQNVAVVLMPQAFHNTIRPDFFDNTNTNFMFRLMPFYFGAGCCFITGTSPPDHPRGCCSCTQSGRKRIVCMCKRYAIGWGERRPERQWHSASPCCGAFVLWAHHCAAVTAGTNVMIRARACFLACKFGEADATAAMSQKLFGGASRHRQLFSEVLVAEDVDLGSRIHALGYKCGL
jgi:hypothetical protein